MKLKLSCTAGMVPGSSLIEKGHFLRKMGYQGMTVFCDYPDWKEEYLDEMLRLEEETGIKVCEFAFTGPVYGHLMDKDPAVRAEALALYKRSIDIANRLGAITEMEYEYRPQDPLPLFDPYQKMPPEEEKLYVSIIEALGAEVKDGAWMLIEACNRYETKYLTRLCDCREVLEKASPAKTRRMGLLADFFHIALEEKSIADAIRENGSWIHHVHLGDHNRLAPGWGNTDWKAGMRSLKDIGFDGFMNLECCLGGPAEVKLPEIREFLLKTEAEA